MEEKKSMVSVPQKTNGGVILKDSESVVAKVVEKVTQLPLHMREGYRYEVIGQGEGAKFHPDGSLAEVTPAVVKVTVTKEK